MCFIRVYSNKIDAVRLKSYFLINFCIIGFYFYIKVEKMLLESALLPV